MSPELKYGPSTDPSTDQTVLKPYSSTEKNVLNYGKNRTQLRKKTYSTTENRTQTVPKPRIIYSVLSSSSGLFALDRSYQRRKSRGFLFLLPICRAVFIFPLSISAVEFFVLGRFWVRSSAFRFRQKKTKPSSNPQPHALSHQGFTTVHQVGIYYFFGKFES